METNRQDIRLHSDKYPEDCFIKNVNINENEPRKSCWKGLHRVLWKSIFEDPSMILFWLTFSINWSVKSKAYGDLLESCELHLFHSSFMNLHCVPISLMDISRILQALVSFKTGAILTFMHSTFGQKNLFNWNQESVITAKPQNGQLKNTSIYQGTTISFNSSTVF